MRLFKVLFLIGFFVATMSIAICEILFLNTKNYIMFIILNTLLMIYNKPIILSNIQRKISSSLCIEAAVLERYILFQVLKDNIFIIAAGFAYIIAAIYSLAAGSIIQLNILLIITVNIYLLDVYSGLQRLILITFSCIDIAMLLTNNTYVLPILFISSLCNAIFIWRTFYEQLRNKEIIMKQIFLKLFVAISVFLGTLASFWMYFDRYLKIRPAKNSTINSLLNEIATAVENQSSLLFLLAAIYCAMFWLLGFIIYKIIFGITRVRVPEAKLLLALGTSYIISYLTGYFLLPSTPSLIYPSE